MRALHFVSIHVRVGTHHVLSCIYVLDCRLSYQHCVVSDS